MRVLSLFSGIGAFEKALKKLDVECELVGYCEIDKYASKSYAAIHNVPETMNFGDITKIDESTLPKDIDLITYGFPCQDISLAGKQKGMFNEDGTQTRSGLFFEALRIIEATQPKVAIAENVKNLTSKKFAEQFKLVLDSLEEAGYNNYWKVLNAKDYGIPQNRERVFIISIRKDIDNGLFQFPEGFPLQLRLKDMLENEVDEKYYISDSKAIIGLPNISERTTGIMLKQATEFGKETEVANTLMARDYKGFGNQGMNCVIEPVRLGGLYDTDKSKHQAGSIWDKEAIAPTIDTMQGGNRQPLITTERGRAGKQVAQTLTTSPQQGVVINSFRKLVSRIKERGAENE